MSLHIKQDNTIYLSNILDGIPHLKTDKNGNRYFYFYDRYKKGFINKPRIELDMLQYYNIHKNTYQNRINRGWSLEKALTTPPLK